MMRSVLRRVVFGLVLIPGMAQATQPLPIIVTYEMQRQHDAAQVERRDPKTFWIQQIVARLEDRKSGGTIGLDKPATAKVSFVLLRDGTMVSKSIAMSSGVPKVDKEAMAMLDRAQPFPPMPVAMSERSLAFTLPLRFR